MDPADKVEKIYFCIWWFLPFSIFSCLFFFPLRVQFCISSWSNTTMNPMTIHGSQSIDMKQKDNLYSLGIICKIDISLSILSFVFFYFHHSYYFFSDMGHNFQYKLNTRSHYWHIREIGQVCFKCGLKYWIH